MKYCTKCGNELLDEAVICPKCGCAVSGVNLQNTCQQLKTSNEREKTKYCSKCGNELLAEAIICPKCGCAADVANLSKLKNTSDPKETAIKVFMILGCIVNAFIYLIPLAWCIPMTICYYKKKSRGEPIGTAFKICSLLFVSLIAGILMLCDND